MIETQTTPDGSAEARLQEATRQFEQARAANNAEQTEIAKKMMEDAFNEMSRQNK